MKLFIAATRQNDGKTTTVVGLLNAFFNKFRNVGYIKPVGQKFCTVEGRNVDKDVYLMKRLFQFQDDLSSMSPIVVNQGFTKEYLVNGNPTRLKTRIIDAYEAVSRGKEIVVVEGTGHAGVGSIFDLSNAQVAQLLGAPAIIVTCGGLGKTVDEVMLNKAVFDKYRVHVLGVIVNKVLQENYEDIDKYIRLAFERKEIRVFGVLPFNQMLSNPTIKEVIEETGAQIVSGGENLEWTIDKVIIGAMSPREASRYMSGNVLIITPGSRNDFIIGTLDSHLKKQECECDYVIRGVLLTGERLPNNRALRLLAERNIPVMHVKEDTYSSAKKVSTLLVKTRPEEAGKIKTIKELVEEFVDIDGIIGSCLLHEKQIAHKPMALD